MNKSHVFMVMPLVLQMLLVSCDEQHNPLPDNHQVAAASLSQVIGKDIFAAINAAEKLSIEAIKAKRRTKDREDLETLGTSKSLSKAEVETLKEILFDEKNYQFQVIKKNLLIPEFMITIDQDKKNYVLVSLETQQVKYFYQGTSRRFDLNVEGGAKLSNFIKSLNL